MAGNMSSAMRTSIINYLNTLPGTTSSDLLARARIAVYLVVTSAEYVTQR